MADLALLDGLTDADFRRTMLAALRLLAVLALLAMAFFWFKFGWQSGALLVIGAGISGSSLWEWLRLMTAVMDRMDAGGKARPLGMVLAGFFIRLIVSLVVLYASLKYLHGSVIALATGLGLGVLALTVEGLRLMKKWTT